MIPRNLGITWTFVAMIFLWSDQSVSANTSYTPTWESLDRRPLPQWYDEAKFGIFIHWGVYSVPAFKNEWFLYFNATNEESVKRYMKENYPPGFTYEDMAKKFKGEFFDAEHWAEVFHNAGAKYIVLTSKHHDGFTLWPSAFSPGWNSKVIGPHRDIVGELATAVRNKGIHFGLYYSLLEWYHPLYLKDHKTGLRSQEYVDTKMLPEMRELVRTFLPDVVWVDGQWAAPDKYFKSTEFLAWLYNDSPVKESVVVNDRWGMDCNNHHGGIYTGVDRFNPREIQKHKWENCLSIDKQAWGYRRDVKISDYLTLDEIMEQLISTVSSGGNFLLNIGPMSDGIIPPIFLKRLKDVGAWMKIHGEAIYGTTPWKYQKDSLNGHVWYTQSRKNRQTVYAIILQWPTDGVLKLRGLLDVAKNISSISMLGDIESLKWAVEDGAFVVNMTNKITSPAWGLMVKADRTP